MSSGSLIVVGTGIRTVGHLTAEAIAWLEKADKVLYVVGDPIAEASIVRLNPHGAESLSALYAEGKPRIDTYHAMVERILSCVRSGLLTCAAFYGHPGVFVYPSHEAIRRARSEGYTAKMLPGALADRRRRRPDIQEERL
jgi:precorrin-2 methylase